MEVGQSFLLKQVREQSGYIWHDRVGGVILKWLVMLIVVAGGGLWWSYGRLPPEIPLWLSRPWGQAQLASKEWVWVIPGSLTGLTLIALVVAGMAYREEKLLARMVVGGMGLAGLMLVYALIRIINLAL